MTLLDAAVPGVNGPAPTTYEQFWPYYVSQHLHPVTRRIHVLGTLAGLGCVALSIVLRHPRPALAAPVLGYGPAWYSHFRIERNKPASFGHPLWSARADFRLLRRYLDGTLQDDVSWVRESLGIPDAQATLAHLRNPAGLAAQSGEHSARGRYPNGHGRPMAATAEEGRHEEGADTARPHTRRPTTTSTRSPEQLDLSSFLSDRRSSIEQLVEGYFATDSFAKRGGYAELLVKELSNLTATRAEVLRPVLRELADGHPYLDHFDEARRRQVDLLAQLDDLTVGVGPRDVHQHQPERLIELLHALRVEIHDYDRYEAHELLPFLETHLDPDRLQQLAEKARKASKTGPTHAHATKPPADERSFLGKRLSAFYDRLLNVAEHPERTIQTGGEEGP